MPEIVYSELNGSPKENYSLQDFTITKEFVCAWADRVALKTQLYANGFEGNRCVNVAIEPYPSSKNSGLTSVAAYEQAKLTAQFSLVYWRGRVKREVVGDKLMSEQIVPTTEFLTIPPKVFRWGKAAGVAPDAVPDWQTSTVYEEGMLVKDPLGIIWTCTDYHESNEHGGTSMAWDLEHFPQYWRVGDTSGVDPDAAPGKLVKSCDYLYTLYEVPDLPDTFESLIGSVNLNAITLKTPGMTGITFQPQTLLYNAPTAEREITSAGALAWTQHYRLSFKPNLDESVTPAVFRGWNWFWKADVQGWRQLYIGATPYLQYKPKAWSGIDPA